MDIISRVRNEEDVNELIPKLFDHLSDQIERVTSHLESARPSSVAELMGQLFTALVTISQMLADTDNPRMDTERSEKVRKKAIKYARQMLADVKKDLQETNPEVCAGLNRVLTQIEFQIALNDIGYRRAVAAAEARQAEAEQGYSETVRETGDHDPDLETE